jgi:hypothetical protein
VRTTGGRLATADSESAAVLNFASARLTEYETEVRTKWVLFDSMYHRGKL